MDAMGNAKSADASKGHPKTWWTNARMRKGALLRTRKGVTE